MRWYWYWCGTDADTGAGTGSGVILVLVRYWDTGTGTGAVLRPDRLARSQDGVYQLVPPSSLLTACFPSHEPFDTDRYSTDFAPGTASILHRVQQLFFTEYSNYFAPGTAPILYQVQHSRWDFQVHLFCTRYSTAGLNQAHLIFHLVATSGIMHLVWVEKENTISNEPTSTPPDFRQLLNLLMIKFFNIF